MVHCHCSTVHSSSPNLPVNIPVAGVGLRLPSHRHSLIGKQLPKQAQQNGLKGSQTGLAASASRAVTRVIPRRSVSTAAHHSNADQDLVVSLYWPYKNLPPDGKTRLENEEQCNPEERSCQTPMHVFERACKACTGTGSISSNTRGRRRIASYTCTICHGLGYVRHTSSRFMPPDLNNGSGDFTIGRPVPPPPETDDKKRKYRGLRR